MQRTDGFKQEISQTAGSEDRCRAGRLDAGAGREERLTTFSRRTPASMSSGLRTKGELRVR